MPEACAADLRERVIEAVEEGASRREAAEPFAVSASSAVKWLRPWQKEGGRLAKPRGGSLSPLEDYAEEIVSLVKEQPARTLEELLVEMHKQRIPGSRSGLWRFLERHDISYKKACERPSKNERTWPERDEGGCGSKDCLIRPASSSSVRVQ